MRRLHVIYGIMIIALCTALIISEHQRYTAVGRLNDSPINAYIREPGFPIVFDAEVKEYQLTYSITNTNGGVVTSRYPLNYCPWTGARFPSSHRDELLAQSDEHELHIVRERIRTARTLTEIRAILGEADETIMGGGSDTKIQLTYTNLAKTFDLVVQEKPDGQLSIAAQPKKL